MSKHAPGPWTLSVEDPIARFDSKTGLPLNREHYWIRDKNGSFVITACGDIDTKPTFSLIASAPEMLEALKNMFIKLESASPELRRMVNYNEIEQVISKAEGLNNE